MQLVLSITFLIFFAMYGVVCVKLAHSSLDDREDISIAHLIIIKSEVSTYPIVVIFSSGCVIVVIILLYALGFIYIPGKLGCVFLLLCGLMICANDGVYYGPMVVFLCLHITLRHYQAIIALFMQIMGLCVFGLSISFMMTVRISVLYLNIIINSEVWPICHCLG